MSQLTTYINVGDGAATRRYTGYPLNSTLVSSYTLDTIRSIINQAASGQPYSSFHWKLLFVSLYDTFHRFSPRYLSMDPNHSSRHSDQCPRSTDCHFPSACFYSHRIGSWYLYATEYQQCHLYCLRWASIEDERRSLIRCSSEWCSIDSRRFSSSKTRNCWRFSKTALELFQSFRQSLFERRRVGSNGRRKHSIDNLPTIVTSTSCLRSGGGCREKWQLYPERSLYTFEE